MSISKLSQRPFRALVLEPRILLDAAAVATAAEVAAASSPEPVVVPPTDFEPGVTATDAASTITVDSGSGAQSVDLFQDVQVSLDGKGEELTDLVIHIDRSGSNQALLIDGSSVLLQSTDTTGTTETNEYSYKVSSSDGSTTITISIDSSDAYTAADAAALIDGLKYSVLDDSVPSGSVTVTLVSLEDDYYDIADLNIAAHVSVTSNINAAPELSDDHAPTPAESISTDALGNQVEVVYSSDGKFVYAVGDGVVSAYSLSSSGSLSALSSLEVSGLGDATQLVISKDGRSLYAINGDSNIYHVSIGSDGRLGQASTTSTGNGAASGGLALSDDGAYLYIGTAYNNLVIFNRDGDSGALSILSRAGGDSVRNGVIAVRGDYVYVSYNGSSELLMVYQRSSTGHLNLVAELTTDGGTHYSATDYQLAVSSDGQYLYVGDPDDGSLSVYRFNASEKTLVQVESHALDNLSGLILSDDGSLLYASTDKTIQIYRVAADGSLQLASSTATDGGISDLALSSDGLSLLLADSNGLSRYSLAQNLTLGSSTTFASGLNLTDSNNAVLDGGNGNYKGSSVSVSADVAGGSFGFVDGNGLAYDSASASILYQGAAIASYSVSASGVLSLSFSADTSAQLANQVLHQLSYRNDSATAGSYISLSVQASDGALSSAAVSILLRVNSVPVLDDRLASSYQLPEATSETPYSHTLDAALFADTDGDSLSWSVTGLPEGLTFDAATRTLSGSALVTGNYTLTISAHDASGASASFSLDLQVDQIENRAPIVNTEYAGTAASTVAGSNYSLSLASLFSDADSRYGDNLTISVAGLPEGLSYDAATQSISGSSSALGDYALTITATDKSGASSSTTLTLRVITQAEADNTAPSLLAETSTLHYSSDGTLSGFNQYVNDIELSADGRMLTIAASTSQNAGGSSYLYVYSRDTLSGELSLKQTFVQGSADDQDASNGIEVDGLQGVTSFNYSADGKSLYLTGYASSGSATAYSIVAFSIGDDGSLSATGKALALDQKILQLSVADDGKTLYAISSDSVHAIGIDENGQLSALGRYQPGEPYLSLGTANSMQLDADGNLYVLGGSRLTIYSSADDGRLSLAGQLSRDGSTLIWTNAGGTASSVATLENSNAFSGSNALAVSDQGMIHLTTSNGFLTTLHFDAASQELRFVSAEDAYSPLENYPHGLAISADGSTLYVSSANSTVLAIYSVAEDGKPSLSHTVETGGGVTRLAVSADGQYLYGGKHLYFGTIALSQFSANSVALSYAPETTNTPLQSLTLSDAEFDALDNGQGNYQGATLTLERSEGAAAEDEFGFVDGNGLSLVDGQILLDGAAIASFSSKDGALSLSFSAAVSSATANQVLDQISYRNANATPGQSLNLSLKVSDQYGKSDQLSLALSVKDINDAPSLSARPSSPTYVAGDYSAALFEDVSVSTGDANQSITRLSLTIDGLKDDVAEQLIVGDRFINLIDAMTDTFTLTLAGSSTTVDVAVSMQDGTATVVLSSDRGWSAEATAELIQSLRYNNTSSDYSRPISEGPRTFTLTAISDNGGTAEGGNDTSTLDISSVLSVESAAAVVPPSIGSSGANTSYRSGEAAADLFSAVNVSASQPIATVNFEISGLLDGDNEQLLIDGTSVALINNGSGTTTSGIEYYIEVGDDGHATVYLSSSAGLSSEAASALVDGLGYANASASPSEGTRNITLSVVMDSNNEISAPGITASVDVEAAAVSANQPPSVVASSEPVTYTDGGGEVKVFDNVSVSTGEADQSITQLTLSVSGLQDGDHEKLLIGDSQITLSDGYNGSASLVVDGNSYIVTVAVSVSDGVASVSLNSSGLPSDIAASLIESIRYNNTASEFAASASLGERKVTLTSISDNGGSVTSALNIGTVVSVKAAPPVVSPPDIELPNAETEQVTPTLDTRNVRTTPWQELPIADFATPADSSEATLELDEAQITGVIPGRLSAAENRPGQVASIAQLVAGPLSSDEQSVPEQIQQQSLSTENAFSSLGFFTDGTSLISLVNVDADTPSSLNLYLPTLLQDGSTPQRITLLNGLPLPSWAAFDARTGELRIDRQYLERVGTVRLLLISRDSEGNQQRTPVEIRNQNNPGQIEQSHNSNDSGPEPLPQTEPLPQRLQQQTASALLNDALDLLEQLTDLVTEPDAAHTDHIV